MSCIHRPEGEVRMKKPSGFPFHALLFSILLALSGCGGGDVGDDGAGNDAANPPVNGSGNGNNNNNNGGSGGRIATWELRMKRECGTVTPGTCVTQTLTVRSDGTYSHSQGATGRLSSGDLVSLRSALDPIISTGAQMNPATCTPDPVPPRVGGGSREVDVAVAEPGGGIGSLQMVYLDKASGGTCYAQGQQAQARSVFDQMDALTTRYADHSSGPGSGHTP